MDSEWLGAMVDRYAAALELYARQWCDAPEDVVQEAFLKLVAQRPLPEQPGAWLFRVVRNGALNAAVAARRRRHHEANAAGAAAMWFEAGTDASGPSSLDALAASAALQSLPLAQREAIVSQTRRSLMSSRSVCLGWLALAALASPARAQGQELAARATQIALRPAAAPVPALKYQLLPDRRTLVPGNAAIFYHRAFELLLVRRSREERVQRRTDESPVEVWLNGPLSSIPREAARRVLEANRNSLHEVELGARRQTCDWEFEQRDEAVYLLIEEIQQMRSLSRLVLLRARVAVLDGRVDDAVHWMQTGFAMARHASEGPLLVQSLVGAALSEQMCRALEDLIQVPGVPSLYWALAHRPRPLADFSASFESERFLLEREIPSLGQLDGSAWSAQHGRKFSEELQDKLFKLAELGDGSGTSGLRNWTHRLGMTVLILQAYPEAKRALIAQGRPPLEVEAMPAVQVAALHTFQQYEEYRDDLFKWTSLPYYQGEKGMDDSASGKRIRANQSMLFKLFTRLTPAVRSCGLTSALSERRLDAIQCFEAIRIYAALHGKLPPRLEEITEAPVPWDSARGAPFEYRVEGDRATLSASVPPGGADHPMHKINYELKLTR
jgi:Sigma-70 region 2